jgi:hypothetical protein
MPAFSSCTTRELYVDEAKRQSGALPQHVRVDMLSAYTTRSAQHVAPATQCCTSTGSSSKRTDIVPIVHLLPGPAGSAPATPRATAPPAAADRRQPSTTCSRRWPAQRRTGCCGCAAGEKGSVQRYVERQRHATQTKAGACNDVFNIERHVPAGSHLTHRPTVVGPRRYLRQTELFPGSR